MVRTGVRAECSSLVRAGRRVGVGRVTVAGGLGLVHAGLAEVTATDPRSWPTAAAADAPRGMEAAAAALDATRALVLSAFDARGGGHDGWRGRVHLNGDLDPVGGAELLAALAGGEQVLFAASRHRVGMTATQRRAAALRGPDPPITLPDTG